MNRDLLVIVPARGGSKGVLRKNIKLLGNKPLILWTIESYISSLVADNSTIIVSTDDVEIKEIIESAGLDVPYMRPAYLADDNAKTIDTVKHVIEKERERGNEYDFVMLLQPTVPFREKSTIDSCYKEFKENCEKFSSLVSVCRVTSHHPYLMKKIENGVLKSFFFEEVEGTRRQDYSPHAYMRSGSIYLTTVELVEREGSMLGDKIYPYETFGNENINIDSILDFYTAEAIVGEL